MAQFVLTAQLAITPPKNLGAIARQIRAQLSGININVNVNANLSSLNATNVALNQTRKNAKAASNATADLFKSLSGAAKRFGAIAIVTGIFLNLSRAIKGSVSDAIEFERQLVNLSQVTGKTVKELEGISKEATRISTTLGVSSDNLLKTAITLAQAGLEARKTKQALEVLAKTELASSFDDIASTTEGAIAILSQFKKEAVAAGGDIRYLEQALSSINEVSKKYAVESADLVAVIRRAGGAFEASGGKLNELLALFTSVRATTRESAETIATGLRTIFTRIQRVETIRQLQELGITLQDSKGQFIGAYKAFERIAKGLSSLDATDFRFAAIVEELGGFRQISKVIPLIKQFKLAQDALNTAQKAGNSLNQDAATSQQSLANQITKVKEEFQALIRQFVDSSTFRSLIDLTLQLSKAFINVAESLQPVLPLLAAFFATKIGGGLLPGLNSLVSRRNNGGRIHAFASGGFVPGTGNRDTVPAMLTPGEFVIRKSSVKKLGPQKLAQLNSGGKVQKFANGGIVKDVLSNGSNGSLGVLSLDATGDRTELVPLSGKKLDAKFASVKKAYEGYNFKNAISVRTFPLDKDGEMRQALYQKITTDFTNSIGNAVNSVGSNIASQLKLDVKTPILPEGESARLVKSIGDGAIGSMFEGLVSALAAGGDMSKMGSTDRSFDFVGSIGEAAKLFKNPSLINSNDFAYKDAKKGGFKNSNLANKALSQALKEKGGLSESVIAESMSLQQQNINSLFKAIESSPKHLSLLLSSGGLTKNDFDALLSERPVSGLSSGGKNVDTFNTSLNNFTGELISIFLGKRGTSNAAKIYNLKDLYSDWKSGKKFATGGMARGSDTVPAMLTPGEFVVSRESARKIGYSNLDSINKTGEPKYFASGGPVNPITKISRAGVPFSQKASRRAVQQGQLADLQSIANKNAVAANGTSTSLDILKKSVKELIAQHGKLDKSIVKIIKANIQAARAVEQNEKAALAQYHATQKAQQEVANFGNKISKAFDYAQNFIFLAATVSTVTSQLTAFSDTTRDAIAETSVFVSTTIGLTATLGQFAASMIPLSVKTAILTKTYAGLSIVATTLGVSITALSAPLLILGGLIVGVGAYFYYLKANAKALNESLNKAADDILQSAEQGRGGRSEDFIGKRLEALAALQEQYWFSTKQDKEKEIQQVRNASAALYSLAVSGNQLDQTLLSIENNKGLNNFDKLDRSINALVKDMNSAMTSMKNARKTFQELQGQGFNPDNADGAQKTAFDDARNALSIGRESLENNIKKANENIFASVEELLKGLDAAKLVGKSGEEIFAVYQKTTKLGSQISALENAQNRRIQMEAMSFINPSTIKTQEELDKAYASALAVVQDNASVMYDLKQQIISTIEAHSKQVESTNRLNSVIEQQRVEIFTANTALKFFSQQIDNSAKYMSVLERSLSRLDGNISTISSTPITGLSNLNEIIDPAVFKKSINEALAPFGELASVGKNLGDSADILDKAKKQLLNIRFGSLNIIKVIEDLFKGVNVSTDLRIAISSMIQDAIQPSTEGASMITASEFENIFAPLIAISEPFRKTVESLISSQKMLIDANAAYLTAINKLKQEEIEGRRKYIESDIRLSERLAEAKDKSVSFEEKEAMRNTKRGFGANNRGGLANAFKTTSMSLRQLEERLSKSNDITQIAKMQKAQADLTLRFNNLKSVIEELTDQSDKAADVMSEIEKERAKRDVISKYTQDFVIGDASQRRDIAKQFMGLQFAAGTGTFQLLNANMRSQVASLLDELAGVDDRFKALKKNLIFNDAIRMGIAPDVAGALANATPKEEALINELRAIAAEEKAFQKLLNENVAAETKNLTDKMGVVSQSIIDFPANLSLALSEARKQAMAEEEKLRANAAQAEIDRVRQAAIQEAKDAEEAKKREAFIKSQVDNLISPVNLLRNEVTHNIEALKALTAKIDNEDFNPVMPMQMATGGPVYASRGAAIMKPKGTDTVPAMLTPGEFVMRKAAVDKYGVGFMQAINGGKANSGPYFAEGGFVSSQEEYLKFIEKRVAELSKAVGIDAQDLIRKTNLTVDLGSYAPSRTSAGTMQLLAPSLVKNNGYSAAYIQHVIDHEIGHAIDNYMARTFLNQPFGANETFISPTKGNVFSDIAEEFAKRKNFRQAILTAGNVHSYITNDKDLKAVRKMSPNDIANMTDTKWKNMIQRNPKVLLEGFPIVFESLSDKEKSVLFKDIHKYVKKTTRLPMLSQLSKQSQQIAQEALNRPVVVTMADLENSLKNKSKNPPKARQTTQSKAKINQQTRQIAANRQKAAIQDLVNNQGKNPYSNSGAANMAKNSQDLTKFKANTSGTKPSVAPSTAGIKPSAQILRALGPAAVSVGLNYGYQKLAKESTAKVVGKDAAEDIGIFGIPAVAEAAGIGISGSASFVGAGLTGGIMVNEANRETRRVFDEAKAQVKTGIFKSAEAESNNSQKIKSAIFGMSRVLPRRNKYGNLKNSEEYTKELIEKSFSSYKSMYGDIDRATFEKSARNEMALLESIFAREKEIESLRSKQKEVKGTFRGFGLLLSGSNMNEESALYNNELVAQEELKKLEAARDAYVNSVRAKRFNTGGVVFQSRGTDTVPAMLTPGEFVMKKSAVDKYGKDTMHKMNKGQYMAGGGLVLGKNWIIDGMNRTRKDSYMSEQFNEYAKMNLEESRKKRQELSERIMKHKSPMWSKKPHQFTKPKWMIEQEAEQARIAASAVPQSQVRIKEWESRQRPDTAFSENLSEKRRADAERERQAVLKSRQKQAGNFAIPNNPMAQNNGGMGNVVQKTFENLAGVLNNMQMTHQVNVDGSLNINGVNDTRVAEAIKEYLGDFIVSEVKKLMNQQGFKAG